MFTIVEFFENQQQRLLAVPASWVRDGFLKWPKLGNEAAEQLRKSGTAYHGVTKQYTAITHRKFKHLSAAEAVVKEMLRPDNSNVGANRYLLKRRKTIADNPEIGGASLESIKTVSSSLHCQKESNSQTQAMQLNSSDMEDIKNGISCIQSTIHKMKQDILEAVHAENTTKFEAVFEKFKTDILISVRAGIEHAVESYFEKNISRFASMASASTSKATEPQQQNTSIAAERHKLINNEKEVARFNMSLSNKELFTDYINYFKRIIPTNTYNGTGDSACYVVADCLFKRQFWTSLTWTGINKGHKSTKGFREYGNVLQLIFEVVHNGDPSYCKNNLEDFLKTKIFRYSKQRALSKQLRKSTCRPNRSRRSKETTTLAKFEMAEENWESMPEYSMHNDDVFENVNVKMECTKDSDSNDED
ncbi:uncharacterized protein LOC131287658 [Anopheles ziemanni]|uniref:uncharacterized protein LOC131259188 n=1 Tax=Anopheles coustani TaxID=139045 RepID=UPI00265A9E78|nr:uncharacterized protein LOC131259188 [Anopheles coustani]XP_058172712.1 uncharacterized protein LOC131287658 [Anopheles ziemanni]